jgi:hypothetical protein
MYPEYSAKAYEEAGAGTIVIADPLAYIFTGHPTVRSGVADNVPLAAALPTARPRVSF